MTRRCGPVGVRLLAVTIPLAAAGCSSGQRLASTSGTAGAPSDTGVTVLLYHRFAEPDAFAALRGRDRLYTISTAEFERQLDWLADRGFHFVRLSEAVDFALGRKALDRPAVLITIDDGCRSVLTRAAPILRARRIPAALFVTTDPSAYVFHLRPGEQQLTPDDLQSLAEDGLEFGAHGATHRPMNKLSDAQLADELLRPRRQLEAWIGRPIRALAVPGNWYDERVLLRARAAGYQAVFTSDRGVIQSGCDPMKLPRINVSGNWTLTQFATACSGPMAMRLQRFSPALHHPASIR